MDLEIVGLLKDTNGRCCSMHSCCGEHLEPGDILRLVSCIVTIDGTVEPALKAVKVDEGIDTCTVGFVPRVQATLPKVVNHINKFVQVLEIYSDSKSPYKRTRVIAISAWRALLSYLKQIETNNK